MVAVDRGRTDARDLTIKRANIKMKSKISSLNGTGFSKAKEK